MESVLYTINLAIHELAAIFCVKGPFTSCGLLSYEENWDIPSSTTWT